MPSCSGHFTLNTKIMEILQHDADGTWRPVGGTNAVEWCESTDLKEEVVLQHTLHGDNQQIAKSKLPIICSL